MLRPLHVFVIHEGMLLGGEGYEPGDRVLVLRWRGSVDALVADARERMAERGEADEEPPVSGFRLRRALGA